MPRLAPRLRPYGLHVGLLLYAPALLAADGLVRRPLLQPALGVLTFAVLAACAGRVARPDRLAVWLCVPVATLFEALGSLVWGGYAYRLGNIPLYVPPGHALVFLFGLTAAGLPLVARHERRFRLAVLGACTAWTAAGVSVLPLWTHRLDVQGLAMWPLFAWCVLRSGRGGLFAAIWVATATLELAGTWSGAWTWAPVAPWSHLPSGNPPSAVAAGYAVIDGSVALLAPAVRRLVGSASTRFAAGRPQPRPPRRRLDSPDGRPHTPCTCGGNPAGTRTRGTTMRKIAVASLAALALTLAAAVPALAHHSWGGYHWARQSNPFTLQVGDNVSSQWDSVLDTTVSDWTQSTVLDLAKVAGGSTNKRCRPTSGRVEVCNGAYGNNGWLGVAQIWISGSHITQGTVKLNDTYFNTATYNTTAWRNLVSCQEVGHTLGLDHQDENFDNANLGTCMDYTSDPGTNQHPNQGDYDQLLCIYDPGTFGKTLSTSTHSCTGTGHLDSTTTVGSAAAGRGAPADVADLPPGAGPDRSTYVRDLGGGTKLITHVFWARR